MPLWRWLSLNTLKHITFWNKRLLLQRFFTAEDGIQLNAVHLSIGPSSSSNIGKQTQNGVVDFGSQCRFIFVYCNFIRGTVWKRKMFTTRVLWLLFLFDKQYHPPYIEFLFDSHCHPSVARNFEWGGGGKMEKNCDVFRWHNGHDVITDFFEVRFRHNQLEKQNLATSRNFRSPKSKIKGRWRRRAPSAWRFLTICN